MTTAQESPDKRWTALILLCAAQFNVVLDASNVNVALPSIGKGLDFSEANLPWVVNAYAIRSAASCCSADGLPTFSAGGESSWPA